MPLSLNIKNCLLFLRNPRRIFCGLPRRKRLLVEIQASFFAVGNEIIAIRFPLANFAVTITRSMIVLYKSLRFRDIRDIPQRRKTSNTRRICSLRGRLHFKKEYFLRTSSDARQE